MIIMDECIMSNKIKITKGKAKGVLGDMLSKFTENNKNFKKIRKKMILQSYWFDILDIFEKLRNKFVKK